MRRIRFLSAVIAVILLLSAAAPCAFALEAPEVSSARSYITGDAQTGRVLCDANAYTRSEPASLTKIMTVLLAVEAIEREEASLDDMVAVNASSHFDLTDDGTTAHINRGEVISLKDLLYCAMLVSANEACNIIAEHISGSVSEFVALMNARAEELGCSGTHFANTHGLPSKEHYTTARDLFIIAREAMSHELFAELCGTAKYTTARTNDAAPRELENSNALINEDSAYGSKYLYEGAKAYEDYHTITNFPNIAWCNDVELLAEYNELKILFDDFFLQAKVQFITGAKDINNDDDWNSYLATLDSMNLERYLEVTAAVKFG